MAYWRLHYHLVWATRDRLPLIDARRAREIERVVFGKARELGIRIHAFGGIADHVHMVASIPPTLAVSTCVGQFKGASSRAVGLGADSRSPFSWQNGYGALSVGEAALPRLVSYVHHQPEHHRDATTLSVYERTLDPDRDSGSGLMR